MEADRKIKKRHRYACGIEQEADAEQLKDGKASLFFSSPDGQNGELYFELQKLGWSGGGYKAPYDWRISKDGDIIQYCEGDIYLTANNK